jgi:VWFA-related protein
VRPPNSLGSLFQRFARAPEDRWLTRAAPIEAVTVGERLPRNTSSKRIPAVCAAVLCLAGAAVRGQQKTPADDAPTVFRTETRVVVCNTTVIDKNGHLVTDLRREAFAVYENGVAQRITDFKHEDVPVSLGLIVDNSGSMRTKRAGVEAASLALVKDSNPEDEVFVVNFNDEPFLDLPNRKNFTNNIQEMEEALTRIDSRGGTAMRDALRFSIDHLLEKASRDKKVLVVVTDGVDNSSFVTQASLVKAAQQSGVLVYAVGLLGEEDRGDASKAKHELNGLAEATGGETYYPKDVSEVDQIAHVVAHDIRNQYTIQYTPSNNTMDGTYRQIKITVNAPGHLTVRARSGYYATPDQGKPASKPGTRFR